MSLVGLLELQTLAEVVEVEEQTLLPGLVDSV
jgi:hypothetical protein